MTIDEINNKRKSGDITRVAELSGIPYKTIEAILSQKRSADTKRGAEVINWFKRYLNARDVLCVKELSKN